jgi:transposase-like protein
MDRSPEEKWQIAQEGIKSGNVSETCRRHGIAPNLFYLWKDEAEQGAGAALGGEKRCPGGNREGPSHPIVGTNAGAEVAGDRNPKKRRGGVSCGVRLTPRRERW